LAWDVFGHTSGVIKDDENVWLDSLPTGQINIGIMGKGIQGEKRQEENRKEKHWQKEYLRLHD
jgi:hypothetical protein